MRATPKIALTLGFTACLAAAWAGSKSGPQPGEGVNAFEPTHVTGPDAGTQTCPVCKYGPTPAAQVWVNSDSLDNAGKIAETLEKTIAKHGLKHFRAFVVYLNPKGLKDAGIAEQLRQVATKYKLKNVALTYLSSAHDDAAKEYAINPSAKNTVLIYSQRKVVANYVDLKADGSGLAKLAASAEKAVAN